MATGNGRNRVALPRMTFSGTKAPAWVEEILFKGRKVKREELPEEKQKLTQEAQDLVNLYSKLVMEFITSTHHWLGKSHLKYVVTTVV